MSCYSFFSPTITILIKFQNSIFLLLLLLSLLLCISRAFVALMRCMDLFALFFWIEVSKHTMFFHTVSVQEHSFPNSDLLLRDIEVLRLTTS